MTHDHNWRLENGLSVIGERHPQMKSVSLGFFVKTGSRDEPPQVNGVSHFLEHMMFKGSLTRSGHEIDLAFDRMGAEYNAFTGYEYTGYYARVLPEHTEGAFELLAELMEPALRQEDFEVEKKVILEEIALYEDRPSAVLQKQATQAFYGDHPLGQEILGSSESIKALSQDQMAQYFRQRYVPENITLAVTGCFEPERIRQLAQRHCAHWASGTASRSYPAFKAKPQVLSLAKENVTRAHGVILSPAPAYQDPDFECMDLLADILGHPGNSRLHWALVDKGLVDYASVSFHAQDRVGVLSISFSSAPESTETILQLIQAQIQRLLDEGIKEEELASACNRVLTALATEGEQSLRRLFPLAFDALYDQPYRDLKQVLERYRRVSVQDVYKLLETYPFSPQTVATLGPKTQ